MLHNGDTSHSNIVSPAFCNIWHRTRVRCHFRQQVKRSKRKFIVTYFHYCLFPTSLIFVEGWTCPSENSAGDSSIKVIWGQVIGKKKVLPHRHSPHASILLLYLVERVGCALRWQKNKDGAQHARSPFSKPLVKKIHTSILWGGRGQMRQTWDKQWEKGTRNIYSNTGHKCHCTLLRSSGLKYFA